MASYLAVIDLDGLVLAVLADHDRSISAPSQAVARAFAKSLEGKVWLCRIRISPYVAPLALGSMVRFSKHELRTVTDSDPPHHLLYIVDQKHEVLP